MNDVEIRRRVPAAVTALICVLVFGLFQLLMLSGAYEIDAGVVRKIAPFLYNPFRKLVGEHPSTRPQTADAQTANSRDTAIETITGLKPGELSIQIDGTEAEQPAELPVIIPVSEPDEPNPLDSDEPVG